MENTNSLTNHKLDASNHMIKDYPLNGIRREHRRNKFMIQRRRDPQLWDPVEMKTVTMMKLMKTALMDMGDSNSVGEGNNVLEMKDNTSFLKEKLNLFNDLLN